MLRKKTVIIAAVSILALAVCVGATFALLSDIAGPVQNSFTYGDISISLTETTGDVYQLIPGKRITKDPKITVLSDSENCWLFVKITKSEDFDDYLTYSLEDGWTHLGGYDGVYYRSADRIPINTEFGVLKDNLITVKDNLTAEIMSGITEAPTIAFKAYAIQSYSIETALDAWKLVLEEGE